MIKMRRASGAGKSLGWGVGEIHRVTGRRRGMEAPLPPGLLRRLSSWAAGCRLRPSPRGWGSSSPDLSGKPLEWPSACMWLPCLQLSPPHGSGIWETGTGGWRSILGLRQVVFRIGLEQTLKILRWVEMF